MYHSINIVIPVYNEGKNITKTLSEINSKIKTRCDIFVVYDFEQDDTLPSVKDCMQKNPNISLVKNKFGNGVLNAIKTGFDSINDGVILVVMADLADELDRVDEMFEKANEGYNVICGSRYMKGGRQIGGPWLKKLLSRIAGVSLYHLIGLPTHDVTNSFKMYTKEVLENIAIESNGGFELGMEVVLKAFFKGYKITEVPSIWHDRSTGKSRFRLFKWLPKYLHWYWFGIKKCYSR